MEHLRAELEKATAALRELMASWPYAFAMAGAATAAPSTPTLRAVRREVAELRTRCGDLEARIAEHL